MLVSRRNVVRGLVSGALVLAVRAAIGGLPKLSGSEPDAITLGYVADAARIDPSLEERYRPGRRCARCYFYQGRSSSDYAPCTIFAGWRVSARGWCREFTAR